MSQVRFERFATRGDALGKTPEGRVVAAPNVAPGELAEVSIRGKGARRAFGVVTEVLDPHPERVKPTCDRTERCGACPRMFLSYEGQLAFKAQALEEALKGLQEEADIKGEGATTAFEIRSILQSPQALGYRQRASFVASGKAGALRLGGYGRGSHNVISLGGCPVSAPILLNARDRVKEVLDGLSFPPYNEATGKGGLRHVLVQGNGLPGAKGRVYITLVIADASRLTWGKIGNVIKAEELPCGGRVQGVAMSISKEAGNRILGEEPRVLAGADTLEVHIGAQRCIIPPGAFVQVNLKAADILYHQVEAWAREVEAERALDLYCGVGAMAHRVAPYFGSVIGIESAPLALKGARLPKKRFPNVSFLQGDVTDVMAKLRPGEGEVVIVNPPRKGLAEDVPALIRARKPQRVLYVSCNPKSLARDLARFKAEGPWAMVPKVIQPVDLFPHTEHLETVTLLEPQGEQG